MPERKLALVKTPPPPDTELDKVRRKLKTTKVKEIPQCPVCHGRTYMIVYTATLKQKACVFCLARGKRIVAMS